MSSPATAATQQLRTVCVAQLEGSSAWRALVGQHSPFALTKDCLSAVVAVLTLTWPGPLAPPGCGCAAGQACMYRAMPGEEREEKLKQLVYQLDVLEATCRGPYMAGLEVTAGDATWLGTMVFLTEILPRIFHWKDGVFQGRPKLAAWWALMKKDPAAAKVCLQSSGGGAVWRAARSSLCQAE